MRSAIPVQLFRAAIILALLGFYTNSASAQRIDSTSQKHASSFAVGFGGAFGMLVPGVGGEIRLYFKQSSSIIEARYGAGTTIVFWGPTIEVNDLAVMYGYTAMLGDEKA